MYFDSINGSQSTGIIFLNKLLKQNEMKFFVCEKILYDVNLQNSAVTNQISIKNNHNIITEKFQFHLVS